VVADERLKINDSGIIFIRKNGLFFLMCKRVKMQFLKEELIHLKRKR
jgi:hypothetical protein